jgi:hypothetical protein
MIARSWRARSSRQNAPLYAAHFKNHVLPVLKPLQGYLGGVLLELPHGDEHYDLTVITFWSTLEEIKQFAGNDIGRAVVAREAAALLRDFDAVVTHSSVVETDLFGNR